MASISSKKVAPITDEYEPVNNNEVVDPLDMISPEDEDDEEVHYVDEEVNLATVLKRATQRTFFERLEAIFSMFTYENLKYAMRYLLDTATCTITVQVRIYFISSNNSIYNYLYLYLQCLITFMLLHYCFEYINYSLFLTYINYHCIFLV